jgi:hypothetical protein
VEVFQGVLEGENGDGLKLLGQVVKAREARENWEVCLPSSSQLAVITKNQHIRDCIFGPYIFQIGHKQIH